MKNLTHKDYTTQTATYQLMLPLNKEILIPKDDSVRLLSQVMEDLDYTDFYKAYSPKGRKSAVSPKNLFKIIVYGYMNMRQGMRQGTVRPCRILGTKL